MEQAPAAAWFVDPQDASQWRWWDGAAWSDHVAPLVPPEQRAASSTSSPASQDGLDTRRWPLPACDSPLVPKDGYSKIAHASVRQAYRAGIVQHAFGITLTAIGSVLVIALGIAWLRIDASVLSFGLQMVRRKLHGVRLESREAPWMHAFRQRGLQPAPMITTRSSGRGRMLAALSSADGVDMRSSATGSVRGFEATCGELCAQWGLADTERWSWMLHASFVIPPNAAARHPRVTVRERRLGVGRREDGALSGDRRISLESIAVDQAITIDVHPSIDDVSARELFGPQLVAALAEFPVCWDQRGDVLFVFRTSSSEPIQEFDRFLEAAAAVARAYWMDQE